MRMIIPGFGTQLSVKQKKLVQKLFDGMLDWFFPRICLLCDRRIDHNTVFLCESCWDGLPPNRNNSLQELWLYREHPEEVALDGIFAFYAFNESVQKIVHEIKYRRRWRLWNEFAAQLRHSWPELPSFLSKVDLLIPVPLHKKRLKERGFNQSALLARSLAGQLHITWDEGILQRTRHTRSQTELTAPERRLNVRGAFTVTGGVSLKGKKCALVDDLLTTGSTMNDCAVVLKHAGAGAVYGIAFARA